MASRRVTIEFLGDDKSASRTARSVDSSVSKMGDTFKRVGKAAAIGLGVGIAAAGVALFRFGKDAAAEAKEARKITAQTNAVIKSTGGIANVTAAEVGKLAEALSVKAGIDDELIQSGANVLLTFKNVRNEVGKGNDIFNQATTIALDMSAALGQDMKSSSIQLGKALNDPITGISALSRVGVTFTEKQKKVIESLVKSGDRMKAQKVILRELTSEFGGSAAAQADAGDKARVAWGNFQEWVGMKLLPIIDRLAVWFTLVAVPAMKEFVKEAQTRLAPVVAWLRDKFAEFVSWLREHWPEISRTVRKVMTDVVEVVRGVIGLIQAFWRKWGEDIVRVTRVTFRYIYDGIRAAMKIIRGVINVVTGLIKGDWSQVWKGIKQIFGGVWDGIKNTVKTALGLVREIIRSGWDAVKNLTKNAWELVKQAVAAGASKVVQFIRDLPGRIKAILAGLGTLLVAAGRDMIRGFLNGIKEIWSDVVAFAKGIPGRIVRAVGDLGHLLYEAGKALISGLIEGIKDSAPDLDDAAGWIADQVNDSYKFWEGIGSPSKVWKEFGRNLIEGLAEGVKDPREVFRLLRAVRSVVEAVDKGASEVRSAFGEIPEALGKQFREERGHLLDLTRAYDAAVAAAARASDRLQAAIRRRDAFAASVRQSVMEFGNITAAQSETDKPQQLTARDIVAEMKRRLAAQQAFNHRMKLLLKRGLNKQTYRQLLEQGVEGAGATVRALLQGGKGAVKQVNNLQGDMAKAAKRLGHAGSRELYQAGVDSSRSLLAGLKVKVRDARKVAREFAQTLAGEIRHYLRSHPKLLTNLLGGSLGKDGGNGGGGNGGGGGGGSYGPGLKGMVHQMAARKFGWKGGRQWRALEELVQRESSWIPTAQNPTSSAYGLFQFLDSTWGTVGGSKTSNPRLQALYGLRYIAQRYGGPRQALAFHSRNGWYGQGLDGAVFRSPTLIGVGDSTRPERVSVTPELGRGRGMTAGDVMVAELHVYLDSKEIQNGLVRLKRRNGGVALGIG